MTDTLLKSTAMNILRENLGIVETERFIALILKEPFDYTQWRMENLRDDMSVDELSAIAMEHWNNNALSEFGVSQVADKERSYSEATDSEDSV